MKWFLCYHVGLAVVRPLTHIICTRSMSVFGLGSDDVIRAASLLSEGKLIALPTDTIYGLAAVAQNTAAIQRLYETKGRDCRKPIAICVGSVEDVGLWGQVATLPSNLLNELLPGPVTVVLNRTTLLNPSLNPDTIKVGIRIPDYSFIQDVSKLLGTPLALTSANRSNEPSCLQPSEFQALWPCLGAVFDGGIVGKHREGSTVVDLSEEGKYHVLRPGSALVHTRQILESFCLVESNDIQITQCQ